MNEDKDLYYSEFHEIPSDPEVQSNESEITVTLSKNKTSKKKPTPKIAVSLSANLSSSVVPLSELEEMFEKSNKFEYKNKEGKDEIVTFKDHIIKLREITNEIQDQNFKPVRLTNQEQKLCYALSYLLTIEEESPQFNFEITETEKGSEDPLFVPMIINASIIAKIMTGERRKRHKENVLKLLLSISRKVQVFNCPYKKRKSKDEKIRSLLFTFPLIVNKGIVQDKTTDKEGNGITDFVGMKADLLRPFFNNIRSQNTPLDPVIFKLWIDSDLFANLFSKLNELWYYAWVGFHSAKKIVIEEYGQYKANQVPEMEHEIAKRRKEAITRHLDFDSIQDLTEDYQTTKTDDPKKSEKERIKISVRKTRFKSELKKCLERLIEYGIITSAKINEEKKQIVVIFNPNFKGNEGKFIDVKKEPTKEAAPQEPEDE